MASTAQNRITIYVPAALKLEVNATIDEHPELGSAAEIFRWGFRRRCDELGIERPDPAGEVEV